LLCTLLFFVDKDFEKISQYLDTLLDLAFDQVENTFSEVFVQSHALGREVVVCRPLEAVVSFVVIFLS
jgi:hypothetical protein